MSRRLALAVAAVVLVLVGGLLAWRFASSGTTFEHAVEMAPAGTQRITWTDWAAVRDELDADVDLSSPTDDLAAFLAEAFDRDLSAGSVLGTSAETLHEKLALSPANLEWELLAQSGDGAVVIMQVPSEDAARAVAERLDGLGWEESDGIWRGGPDVAARVGPLTPELQHLAVLEGDGLVLASDEASYLTTALEAVRGDSKAVQGLQDVADDQGEPLSAVVYTGAHACEKLAMAQADADAQSEGERLVAAAGGVHPLTAFAMGRRPTGNLRVSLEVEDADDAEADAEARATLATGPAPGQGGDFTDRFRLDRASVDGRVITLDLEPVAGQYVLSDLSSGPVLFATC